MSFTTNEKNKRIEILKEEEKVISEMNDSSELLNRLNEIKKKYNETFTYEDEKTLEQPLKIALPEIDNSI